MAQLQADPKRAAKAGLSVADCAVTVETTTTKAKETTRAEILADKTLSSADKASLLEVQALSGVRSKNYSQFITGAAYTVTHGGKWYYDGTKAWVGTTYRGYKGSHHCTINYALGVTITKVACSESGATSYRNMYYGYNVTVSFLTYGYSGTATVKSNGTATGWGVSYS